MGRFILERLLKIDQPILAQTKHFQVRHNLTHMQFLKVFNLYQAISFMTAFNRIHSKYPVPMGRTPGANYRRLDDIRDSGVDMETLRNDSFPQLKLENTIFVEQLFEDMALELDLHTRLLSFESFIRLIVSFRSATKQEKVEKFFRMVDEDQSGTLSFNELNTLVRRALLMLKIVKMQDSDLQFYTILAEFFSKFLF